MPSLPRRHPGPRTSKCCKCGKTSHFWKECRICAHCEDSILIQKTQNGSLQPMESGELRTVCLMTRDEMNNLRKHTADNPCADQELDTPCSVIRFKRKLGRRRVRRKRPTLLKALSRQPVILENGEVTLVDSVLMHHVQRSKGIPTVVQLS